MIKQCSSNITSFLLKENIIVEDNKEIYQFGTERIIKNLIVICVIGLIATIFDLWIETIFNLLGFIVLRKYAGGYHSETLLRCNILTFLIYGSNMILINYFIGKLSYLHFTIICIISISLIFLFAPVDHKNLVLSTEMIRNAKIKSRISITIMIIVTSFIIYLSNEINLVSLSTMMGALTASISIFIGRLKRRREKNERDKFNT